MRFGTGLRVHRRGGSGIEVRPVPLHPNAGRRVAATSNGPPRLRLQLVTGGRRQQYLNDCEVIEEGVHKWVSSMEWHETVYVEGTQLEAFTTSGGLGTMCETYLGKVENLDYKTMRYPGHMKLMNFFFHELLMRQRRELAGEILTNAKPPVDDDVVYIHVTSEGEIADRLCRLEFVHAYYPRMVAGLRSTAIAWTTASSVVAVIEMVRAGSLPRQGFLKQEDIPLDAFLATSTGRSFTTHGKNA